MATESPEYSPFFAVMGASAAMVFSGNYHNTTQHSCVLDTKCRCVQTLCSSSPLLVPRLVIHVCLQWSWTPPASSAKVNVAMLISSCHLFRFSWRRVVHLLFASVYLILAR